MEKWPIFDQNNGLTPLEKSQFFDLDFLILQPRKAFCFQTTVKDVLLAYIAKKKKMENGQFLTKPWTNPFGKISILRLFVFLVFIAQTGVFAFQTILEHIFLSYIALNKQIEKQPIFDRNDGLTPLEKSPFFSQVFLWEIQPQKIPFLIFWVEKNSFQTEIVKFEKSPEISKICKGISPWLFSKKQPFFSYMFLWEIQPQKIVL